VILPCSVTFTGPSINHDTSVKESINNKIKKEHQTYIRHKKGSNLYKAKTPKLEIVLINFERDVKLIYSKLVLDVADPPHIRVITLALKPHLWLIMD
jgi:hypothetical protein